MEDHYAKTFSRIASNPFVQSSHTDMASLLEIFFNSLYYDADLSCGTIYLEICIIDQWRSCILKETETRAPLFSDNVTLTPDQIGSSRLTGVSGARSRWKLSTARLRCRSFVCNYAE